VEVSTLENFKAVLVEGLFHETDLGYVIQPDGYGPQKAVEDELNPLVGQRVRLAMHHLPPNLNNPDESKWGGGSCLWQPHRCPAGHHDRPGFLLNVTGDGVLRRDADRGRWHLDLLDGSRLDIPFHMMVGHIGRLAAATLVEVDQMRDSLSMDDLDKIEGLGAQLHSMKELLERLKKG
jgi:hypothetical protein